MATYHREKRNFFITGATGFLGSNLAKILIERGEKVTVLIRKGSRHSFLNNPGIMKRHGDISDLNSLIVAMRGCTHIFHTAGYLSYNKTEKEQMYLANVKGTENICQAALECSVKRLVHVSSTAAIGIPDDPAKPADENHIFSRKWIKIPYMNSKKISEVVALSFIKKGLDVVVVNPSTFYGPGDVKMHTGEIFRQIYNGTLRIAPPGGNGIVDIKDCAEGLILACEKGRTGERYILNSMNLTFLEIFNTIAQVIGTSAIKRVFPRWLYYPFISGASIIETLSNISGRPSKLNSGTVKMSWQYRYFDSSKARNELGWKSEKPFKETCSEAFSFYRSEGLI